MQEIFEKRQDVDYNLRFQTDFVLPGVNTTYFGLHSLRYFSSKIWNVIPDEIKNSLSLDKFKIKIRQWAPSACHCKLCRSYIQHVGYVNISPLEFSGAQLEKKKENKSLVRLALLLQVIFCPCRSFTLGSPNGIPFPDRHDVTHSKKYWSNETLAIQHRDNIIIPYFEVIREELLLPEDQKCLLNYDVFKAQTTDKYREHLDENNIAYVQVPPNLTHIFQPLDLNVIMHSQNHF